MPTRSTGTAVRMSSMATTATALMPPAFRSAISIPLAPWPPIPASTRHSFWTLRSSIHSYNLRHFTPITTISIPGINGFPRQSAHSLGTKRTGLYNEWRPDCSCRRKFSDPIAVPPPAPVVVPTPAPTPTPTAQTPTITSLSPSGAIAGGPSFTITVNGTNFLNNSVVQFNSTALATTFVSSTQLQATVPAGQITFAGVAQVTVANPAASGGTSGSSSFLIGTTQIGGNTLAVFNQPAKDIVFDPLRQVIYLTVPATAPNGNSIAVFDLATGTVIGSQFAGSNPNLLAISDDNQFLVLFARRSCGSATLQFVRHPA